MTATKEKPTTKTKSEERAKAPPPEPTIPDKETRIIESWPRLEKLHDMHDKAMQVLKDCESDLDEARGSVKKAQGNVDELNRKLHQAMDEIEHPDRCPLYNAAAAPNGTAPDVEVVDESWRAQPIVEALPGLGKKVYDGMEKAQLRTFGELIDWKNGGSGERWWTDLEGVGKGAATKIDDAIEAFFERWAKRGPKPPHNPDVQDAELTVKGLLTGPATANGTPKGKRGKKAGNSSAPAGAPLVPEIDPASEYDAILADMLSNFKTIKDDGAIRAKLSEAKLVTVADVFKRRKAGGFKTAFDCLRAVLVDMAYADVVWEAIKARAKEVAEKDK